MISSLHRSDRSVRGVIASLVVGVTIATTSSPASSQSFDPKLVPTDLVAGDGFGRAVALFGDRMVVGAPGADVQGANSGAVYVFEKTGSTWTQTAKLTATSGGPGDEFGRSVALTATRIVVGAPGESNGGGLASGVVHVFERSAGTWVPTIVLTANDGQAGDGFGSSVAAEFDRVVVGAPFADGIPFVQRPGAVYVFDRSFGVWAQSGKIVETQHGQDFDGFGTAVDLSGDRVIASAPSANDGGNQRGRVRICEITTGGWDVTQILQPDTFPHEDWQYGTAVAIDGDRAIATSPLGGPLGGFFIPGIADVHELVGFSWTRVERIAPADVDLDDLENGLAFGTSCDLDGDVLVVGSADASQHGDGRGAVWVLRKTAAGWLETAKVVAPDSAVGDVFGAAVAVDGDRVACGVSGDDDHGSASGSAWAVRVQSGDGVDFAGTPAYLNPCGVSCGLPGAQTLFLDVGVAHAGATYFVLGSVTGTSPGLSFAGFHLPLNLDAYTLYTTSGFGGGPLIPRVGVLDANGRASLGFVLPPSAALAGLPLDGVFVHHAAVLLDPQFGFVTGVTNATHFTFSP
ncbi:MAG: FG-GAP repeat protein [Planctomycetes bacterium]|nr:FG-GAP repeat protein [Planctomycetota bacterium]